ncbi:MAG: tripartite tricarboxylate transporter TctB family protein [Gemmatimonadota bacterium]
MSRRAARLALTLVIGVLFALAAVHARSFPFRARVFPMSVGGAGALLALVTLLREWTRDAGPESPAGPGDRVLLFRYLTWVLAYYGLIWLIGFVIASAVFVVGFLWREARARPWVAALAGTLTGLALWVMGSVLRLQWIVGRIAG